jgi:Mg/Co/Ni transporter MgtE
VSHAAAHFNQLSAEELCDAWPALAADERAEGFRLLPPDSADEFFLTLAPLGQAQILTCIPEGQRRLFQQHGFLALPVLGAEGRMKGIVTIDDIVDVVQEEATEDAQKFGGMEALDAPYLQTSFWNMIKKRAGWLAVLFLGEIVAWQSMFQSYGEHYGLVAITVGVSLVGVVAWGTITGSMLPFVLRRFHLDPASASAPFVATLVDVLGLIIYFEVARVVLGGAIL